MNEPRVKVAEMRCPVCGGMMEKGTVSGRYLFWSKKKRRHFFAMLPKDGEVFIRGGFFGLRLDAHICKVCKRILVDYGESDYEER